jgi:CMP-N-acetylneuraminic acid synthetase
MLWTHVTSPFIGENDYTDMIEAYFSALKYGTHDSLATVTVIQKFLWNGAGPINYDRKVEKWPRTQTLKPIYELNSGAFIVDVSLGRILFDRIGEKPLLFPLSSRKGFDIDWEEDFAVAEHMYRAIGPLC